MMIHPTRNSRAMLTIQSGELRILFHPRTIAPELDRRSGAGVDFMRALFVADCNRENNSVATRIGCERRAPSRISLDGSSLQLRSRKAESCKINVLSGTPLDCEFHDERVVCVSGWPQGYWSLHPPAFSRYYVSRALPRQRLRYRAARALFHRIDSSSGIRRPSLHPGLPLLQAQKESHDGTTGAFCGTAENHSATADF